MKRIIEILFILILSNILTVSAQQAIQFTQNPWALPYYNAGAIAETKNTLSFTLFYRSQFTGFKDTDESGNTTNVNPRSFAAYIESYTKKAGCFGLNISSDKLGYDSYTDIQLGYCYKIPIRTGHLGIGFQVNLLDKRKDPTKYVYTNDADPIKTTLGQTTNNWMNLDFNFGLFYRGKNWYAGISATNLAEKIILSGDKSFEGLTREFIFTGGYEWLIPNSNWSLEPSAFIKTNFATAQYDIMLLAKYNKILWTGLVYRVQDAVGIVFGAKPFANNANAYLKGMEIGIAYDFPTSKIGFTKKPSGGTQTNSFGGFEIMLRYGFGVYKDPVYNGYGNSRYLYRSQY